MTSLPERLGSYRRTRLLHKGQDTEIWKAVKDGATPRYALKILSPSCMDRKAGQRRLKHESVVASQLSHEGVVRFVEYHTEGALVYSVLELFSGIGIRQLMRTDNASVRARSWSVLAQAAAALQVLHEHGWVHADVNPANLLINEAGQVKLLDFTSARRIHAGQWRQPARRPLTLGGISYMSPEYIRGQTLDARADVYSLACVVYELLSGRPPYTGSTPNEVLNKHLNAPVPAIACRATGGSPSTVELVQRMLAKAPERRPESMQEIVQICQDLLDREEQVAALRTAGAARVLDREVVSIALSSSEQSSPSAAATESAHWLTSASAPRALQRSVGMRVVRLISQSILRNRVVQAIAGVMILAAVFGVVASRAQRHGEREIYAQMKAASERIQEHRATNASPEEWSRLETELLGTLEESRSVLRKANSSRSDLLELMWTAEVLPQALEEARSEGSHQTPSMAKLAIHLMNAEQSLARLSQIEAEQRVNWGAVLSGNSFWGLVIVDVMAALWLAASFARSWRLTRSR